VLVTRSAAIAILAILAMAEAAAAQTIMKREPPSGALKRGAIILVDDGSCPKGQIKQVIAGSEGRKRTRNCVPRH
jgi:hypothetical protein